jgi:hypothetical protein
MLGLHTSWQKPTNDALQNAYMGALFALMEKICPSQDPNSLQENKLFFPSFYKLHNLNILMDF